MSTEIIEDTKQAQDILLKAVVTTTDQGIFEAVISTEALDRENDRVSADGMVKALSKWPRPIPLIWEHGTAPKDIFGVIDPTTVKNVGGEVHAGGQVDLESKMGVEAWRSFKSKSLGFSFHYLTLSATKNAEGGQDIAEFDVFEITATRMPMNNGTYVVSTKSADPASEADLRKQADAVVRKQVEDQLPDTSDVEPAPGPIDELRAQIADVATAVKALTDRLDEQQEAAEVEAEKKKAELARTARPVDELRQRSDQTALALATDGASLRKSKPAKQDPPSEPLDEATLKRESRDVMLALLMEASR